MTNREKIFDQLIAFNGTHKITLKCPKIPMRYDQPPSRLSILDHDWFTRDFIRQFYINTNRVAKFEMLLLPEDRDINGNFIGLHYHGVVKSNNIAKFHKVAWKKYRNVLETLRSKYKGKIYFPNHNLVWFEKLDRHMDMTDRNQYENYILKHFIDTDYLVNSMDFLVKKPKKLTQSISMEVLM